MALASDRRGRTTVRAPAARVDSAATATAARDRVEQRGAARQLAGQRAVEGVAGARSCRPPRRAGQGSARAHRRRPRARPSAPSVTTTGAPVRAASTRAARSGSCSPASARASSRLGVSRGERSSSAPGQLARRGRVEHDLEARPRARPAPPRARARRAPRSPSSTTPRPLDARRAATRLDGDRGAELGVGARRDRDLVLARLVDHDQRDAGRRCARAAQTARDVDRPRLAGAATASSPRSSSPTAPTIRTRAPSRAAETAWLAPLPPPWRSNVPPATVSPGRGSVAAVTTRSTLTEPTT